MPTFSYKAIDISGNDVKGIIESVNQDKVIIQLQQESLIPIEVNRVTSDLKIPFSLKQYLVKRITSKEFTSLVRHLSILLDAGIPIDKSFATLKEEIKNQQLKNILLDIEDKIKKGKSLSEAFAYHPKIFSEVFVNMIKAGETGGVLDEVVETLATYTEKEDELKERLITMMIYPLLLVSMGLITIFFLFNFVIPKFVTIFAKMSSTLPLPTQLLIIISTFINKYWWLLLLVSVGIGLLLNNFLKSPKGKVIFDKIKLQFPVIGDLIYKTTISRFALTLGVLIKSGVPILEALNMTKQTVKNKVISEAIKDIHIDVKHGKNISDSLNQSGIFPPLLIQAVNVGERTGKLNIMLIKIATGYDREVENGIKRVMVLFEQIIILGMGLFVGFIVMAMLMPIFKMNFILE